jgi:hypothetical protein
MSRLSPRLAAASGGAVLVALGLLGLIPGVTSHYGQLHGVGRGSRALLFGTFKVSILLDLVRLAAGAAGLWLARTVAGARAYLLWAGIGALTLWLLGVAGLGDWVPLNLADNWLHLLLGSAFLGLGFTAGRSIDAEPATA